MDLVRPQAVTHDTCRRWAWVLSLGLPELFTGKLKRLKGRMTKIHDFGESYQMYLKAAAELEHGSQSIPVPAIADRLGVATVSASEMIHRLQDRGMIRHQPYKGVRLTTKGRQAAALVVLAHRLWERFLVDHLELGWVEAHDMACDLEHLSGPRVVEALDAFLDRPATCPHGNPIPRGSNGGRHPGLRRLSDCQAGEPGRIACIHPESAPVLEALAARSLLPGVSFTVTEIELFDGPRSLLVDGELTTLGRKLADHIWFQPVCDGDD